jgi:hypothetical protein
MKLIPLKGKIGAGKSIKVDDDVYEWAKTFSWSLTKDGYAKAWNPAKKKMVYLHREMLMDRRFTRHRYVDHKSGDTLDYRRENLRPCTMSQNQMNSRKRSGATSRYKGVSWNSQYRKWQAVVKVNGRDVFLGRFEQERHAAYAYELNAPLVFGEFFRSNFTSAETAGRS